MIKLTTFADIAKSVNNLMLNGERDMLAGLRKLVEELEADISATAPEHQLGLKVGYRQAQEQVLRYIDDMIETIENARE